MKEGDVKIMDKHVTKDKLLEIVALLRGSSVADAKELIDEDPTITEVLENEEHYREAYPKEARRFFTAVDKCNEDYFQATMKDRERIISYGIIFRDMMGTKLPRAKDIRQGTPIFDELMLEGITFMSMYVNTDEAIKLAIKKNPALSSLDPEEVKKDDALYRQALTEGRKLLLEDLEKSKAYQEEQRRKAEEYERKLEEQRKELEEQRRGLEEEKKRLEEQKKEIAQRENYSLMLHNARETDYVFFLPGRKRTFDMSKEEYHITYPGGKNYPGGKTTWVGIGKKDSNPPVLTFPPRASKLFAWLAIEITANRGQVAKNGGRSVIIMVDDWATKRGLSHETSSQKQEAKRDLLEAIVLLQGEAFPIPRTGGDRNAVSGKDPLKRGRGTIGYKVVLDPDVYETLKAKGTCTYYPEALFRVDENLPGAYSIGYAMAIHYFMDNNIKAGVNRVLTMGSLYDNSFLPSIEEVRKAKHSWREKIQGPMNRALDHLLEVGLLESLEYDKTFPGSFEEWLTVRVDFTLKDAPDRMAKLEEKKEQEEAKPKKPRKVARKKKAPEKAESQIT